MRAQGPALHIEQKVLRARNGTMLICPPRARRASPRTDEMSPAAAAAAGDSHELDACFSFKRQGHQAPGFFSI